MSLKYKFDKLNDGGSQKTGDQVNADAANDIERYDTNSHVRNLWLVDGEGKHFFMNYAGLIAGWFTPEENTISLDFGAYEVTMKGRNLESLFEGIVSHMVKRIICIDERYAATKSETDVFVSGISVTETS